MRNVFDAHLHVIDPRFEPTANQGYLPDPFTVADYRAATAGLGVVGGAVVAASFQGSDPAWLRAALAELGPSFVGVASLPAGADDDLIAELHACGARAMRVNVMRGGRTVLDGLEHLARRVHDVAGWGVEVYVDGRDLDELEPRLARLPRLAVDHLGMHRDGLPALLRLVRGGARVKATGFGRVELDVPSTLAAIADADPTALMFGTDLPSTRAARPFAPSDLDELLDAVGPEHEAAVLAGNARAWYGPVA